MESLRNARLALGILVVLILCATLVYHLVWGWSLVDGLYMSLITVTTTGFKEVRSLTPGGKIFTLAVLVVGFSLAVYAGGSGVRAILEEGALRSRRMQRRVGAMTDHFLVCGFGRMGQVLCRELAARPVPFVVVEREEAAAEALAARGYRFVLGDATDDEILRRAGIERARGLAAVLGSDADNVFITLTARTRNPGIFILARCAEARSADKLRAAGADRVMNPYERGGAQMAQVLLRPAVLDFIDEVSRDTGLSLLMEEISVERGSRLRGVSLRDAPLRRELNVIVVAIEKAGGEKTFNPSPEEVLGEGDVLIALGRRASLDRLAELCGHRPAKGRGNPA